MRHYNFSERHQFLDKLAEGTWVRLISFPSAFGAALNGEKDLPTDKGVFLVTDVSDSGGRTLITRQKTATMRSADGQEISVNFTGYAANTDLVANGIRPIDHDYLAEFANATLKQKLTHLKVDDLSSVQKAAIHQALAS